MQWVMIPKCIKQPILKILLDLAGFQPSEVLNEYSLCIYKMKGSGKVRKNHLKQDWTISVDWLEGQTHLAFHFSKQLKTLKSHHKCSRNFSVKQRMIKCQALSPGRIAAAAVGSGKLDCKVPLVWSKHYMCTRFPNNQLTSIKGAFKYFFKYLQPCDKKWLKTTTMEPWITNKKLPIKFLLQTVLGAGRDLI